MRPSARLLVIGPSALDDAVARAFPRCQHAGLETLLGGLWSAGQEPYDGIVVALSSGRRVVQALKSLRRVAPAARIVLTCDPAREPEARHALTDGADDYVLEPVQRTDLAVALQIAPVGTNSASVEPTPTVPELLELGGVLKHLSEGPQAALDRLAGLLHRGFGAAGITVELDELCAHAGDDSTAVLDEPIRRQDVVVGRIIVGAREHGAYTARDAARLSDYAGLLDAVVLQAREHGRWQELAWRDDLTGLRNRRFFEQRLDALLTHTSAQRQRLTVALIDIDDFKSYNDHYGHDTGDELLREVARLLTRCSREHDVVARYGGDEFAIVMWDADRPRVPGSQHPSEAIALAERFRRAIHEHDFQCLGRKAPGPVTLSGGLACFPWDGKTLRDLLAAADVALLDAKRTGKNRIKLAQGIGADDAPPGVASGG